MRQRGEVLERQSLLSYRKMGPLELGEIPLSHGIHSDDSIFRGGPVWDHPHPVRGGRKVRPKEEKVISKGGAGSLEVGDTRGSRIA